MTNAQNNSNLTIEDILNDPLFIQIVEQQDRDLAEAGWTYEEAKSFGEQLAKQIKY